jgi:hypothetical protein
MILLVQHRLILVFFGCFLFYLFGVYYYFIASDASTILEQFAKGNLLDVRV